MSEIERNQTSLTLKKALGIYVLCLASFILLSELSLKEVWFPAIIPVVAYFAIGFILNRKVLRSLIDWHPVYNTLDNVSKAKISSLIFWPISYLVLFFRLMVVRML